MPQHKAYIGIKNAAENSTLELHFTDYIYDGMDWDTWETTNLVQSTIDKIKAANPDKIKIVINSLGGDVMIGLALYNYIKAYKAEKEVEIIGFAASIASVMAMCADKGKLKMAKNSFMIIHAAWSYAVGTADEIREQASNLDKVTNELADIYAQRSGKKASHFTKLWANGDVWLTGEDALDEGLADELFNAEPVKAHVDISTYDFKNIPAALLNGVKKEEDPKTFFSNLKSEFMNIVDSLKAAIGLGKTDKKFENVAGRDAVLDMIQDVLTPVINKIDEALTPAASAQEKPPVAEDPKPASPGTVDPEPENPIPPTTPNVPAPAAESAEIKKLQDQMKKLQDDMAGKAMQPEKENTTKNPLSKVKIEYEAEV